MRPDKQPSTTTLFPLSPKGKEVDYGQQHPPKVFSVAPVKTAESVSLPRDYGSNFPPSQNPIAYEF
jgi:hypothetical protein